MKKLLRVIWKPALMLVPFILGMIGFSVAGEPFLQAFYASLCLYGMGQKELPPNLLIEIARWLAPLVTASAVVVAAKSIRRHFHDATARRTHDSVAIRGPKAEKEAMLKAFGRRGIDMEDKPVKANRYLLLGDEMDNLAYYHTHLADTDRDVFLQSHSLSSCSSSRSNLYLVCPEETAARSFWRQHPLYPLSKAHGHRIDIVIVGFGTLGRELLLYSLRNHIFSPDQRITYRIFGEEQGFRKIYRGLSKISDPVEFHEEPWQDSLSLLRDAHAVIVAQQQDQLALLHNLTLALPGKRMTVLSAHPEGADLLPYGNALLCFDWKKQAMDPDNIFMEDQLKLSKQVNLSFHRTYSWEGDRRSADEIWDETNAFLRNSMMAAAEYHRVQLQLLEGQALTEENVELLAELDHLQWCRFRYLENWTQGEPENGRITDWEKRINRNLKPYQELDQRMKDSSRESVLKHFESENIVTAQ